MSLSGIYILAPAILERMSEGEQADHLAVGLDEGGAFSLSFTSGDSPPARREPAVEVPAET